MMTKKATIGIVVMTVVVAVSAVAIHHMNIKQKRIIDMANAKDLNYSIWIFVQEHGRMPDGFSELAEERYLSPGKIHTVDGSKTTVPKTVADLEAGLCDYVMNQNIAIATERKGTDLNPGFLQYRIKNGDADRTVTLHTKPGLLPGGYISVGFLDGSSASIKANSLEEAATERGWILQMATAQTEELNQTLHPNSASALTRAASSGED
jgi:hypothetical protein